MRQGPCQAKMLHFGVVEGVKISADGLTVENTDSETRFVRCNVMAKSGKWYFEVTVNASASNSICIGVSVPTLDPSTLKNNLGEDTLSWSYDIYRQRKCHTETSAASSSTTSSSSSYSSYSSSSSSNNQWYGEYFSNNDVLGCKLDLDAKKITYYKNGNDLGTAFEAGDLSNPNIEGFYPTASLSRKAKVTFNFDKKKWKHAPKGDDKDSVKGLHAELSEKEYAHLVEVFNKYKDASVNLNDSSDGTSDVIKEQGFLKYGKELGVEDDNDMGLMIVSWKIGAEGQWEFKREEFIEGWVGYGCSGEKEMRKRLDEWRAEIQKSDTEFKKFYYFVFDYLKEDKRTTILTEEAVTVWGMLGIDKKWGLWNKWNEFVTKDTKVISRDNWRQFVDFMKAHPDKVDDYDANASWPTLMDSFVEYVGEHP